MREPPCRVGWSYGVGRNRRRPVDGKRKRAARCKLPGRPASSLRPDVQEFFAEAPDLGPAVKNCIKPLARGRSHSCITSTVKI